MNRPLVHITLIALVCAATFANALTNGFQLDDAFRVVGNPGVTEFYPPWRHFFDPETSSALPRIVQYRPLLPLCLSINYALAGTSAIGFHVGNLLLQILASVSVWLVVRELLTHWAKTGSASVPLFVGMMFAVHPVSGVVVNYVCARDLIMSVGFMMGAFYAYLRLRRLGGSNARWVWTLGLLLLALLSKKNAVAFPALVLAFEFTVGRRKLSDGRAWRAALPFVGVVGGLLLFIRFGLGFSDTANSVIGATGPYVRAQLQHHVFHYVWHFVWPFEIRQLAAEPIVEWKVVVGGLALVASWVLVWRWRSARPLLAFAILGYELLLVLTSSVIPMHSELVPYRPYPSSVFLFVGFGAALAPLGRNGLIAMGGLVLWFAGTSVAMNPIWKNGETLLRHSVKYGGNKIAYNGLCDNLEPGEERIALYKAALQIDAFYPEAMIGLGATEVALGRKGSGLARVRKALALAPGVAQLRSKAAEIFEMAGEYAVAADHAAKAVELAPHNAGYRLHAVELALNQNRDQLAWQMIEPLLRRQPDLDRTRFFAGIALHRLGRSAAAEPLLVALVAMHPTFGHGLYMLGMVRVRLQKWADAAAAFEAALRATPELIDAHNQLVECYTRLGRAADAVRHRKLYQQKRKK